MKTVRPLWGRGQMVSPQHFQQEAAQAAWHTECVARLGAIHPWGVARTAFDAALLKQGKLKADHLCVRFADGTLTDSDNADALPPVMTLPETESHELTVVLALPHEYENGGNCLQPEQKAERPVRWRLAWREVRNRYGDDSRQIAVMQPELTLRTEDNDNGNYQTVAVARLKRDSQGDWSQDASFIPPLLNVQASRWLTEQTEYLTGQLRARLQRLMSMRRESNERMADFAVADVSLFWLLNALNSAEPVLSHLVRYPQVHPERLYQALWALKSQHNVVQQSVFTRDYNYRNAPEEMSQSADVTSGDVTTYGEAYHWADNYLAPGSDGLRNPEPESGAFYARLRHERYLNDQTRLSGRTSSAALAPGRELKVTGGAEVTEVFCQGVVITGIHSRARRDRSYEVAFTAIPFSKNYGFRPQPGDRPVMAGTLPARVSAFPAMLTADRWTPVLPSAVSVGRRRCCRSAAVSAVISCCWSILPSVKSLCR